MFANNTYNFVFSKRESSSWKTTIIIIAHKKKVESALYRDPHDWVIFSLFCSTSLYLLFLSLYESMYCHFLQVWDSSERMIKKNELWRGPCSLDKPSWPSWPNDWILINLFVFSAVRTPFVYSTKQAPRPYQISHCWIKREENRARMENYSAAICESVCYRNL